MKKISVKVRILLFCLVSVTGVIAAIAIMSTNRETEKKTPGIPDKLIEVVCYLIFVRVYHHWRHAHASHEICGGVHPLD